MKNIIYTLFVLLSSIVLFTSCDPNYCADYIIQNDLEQDIEVVFYANLENTWDSTVHLKVVSKGRERVELLCGMSGSPDILGLFVDDSIHIMLEDGRTLKYTNAQPINNIYDTRNRDIWVEEYGKETRWQGGDYRFVFTIDESTVEKSIEGE